MTASRRQRFWPSGYRHQQRQGGVGSHGHRQYRAVGVGDAGCGSEIVDADIYRPVDPRVLASRDPPAMSPDNKGHPAKPTGVKVISVAMLSE